MPRLVPLAIGLCVVTWSCCSLFSSPALYGQGPAGQAGSKTAARPAPGPVAAVGAAANGRVPGQPEWFPLTPEHEKYLNDILKYWEFQATQVQRFRCKFWRWEYDPVTLPRHPDVATTTGQGVIQYAAPDKGLFHVERLWDVAVQQQGNVAVPAMKDGKPQFVERKEVVDDHWVCDGKSLFQYDGRNKQIIQRQLPGGMQGQQIADGPLPFLFGAKRETMMQRYWIRVLPPQKPGRFYLEAIPKRREEAADYKAIHVVIDEKEFLPEALLLFDRAGGHTTYEFQAREKNWNLLPEKLNPWHQQFFAPKPPDGWKLVQEPFQADPAVAPPPTAASSPAKQLPMPRQAVKGPPATGPRR